MNQNTGADPKQCDRMVASTVQAMRQSLGVTVVELAKASGIPLPRLEAVEGGGTTTRAERHDITELRTNTALTKRVRQLTTEIHARLVPTTDGPATTG